MNDGVTRLNNTSIVIKFYRLERYPSLKNFICFSKIIWRLIHILFSCSIPPSTDLRKGVNIAHGIGIVIHQHSIIGENTKIYQSVTIGGGKDLKLVKIVY